MLNFKGLLPIIKMTKEQYKKATKGNTEAEDYICVKDIDQTVPSIYMFNGGEYFTKAAVEALSDCKLNKEKELESLRVDYDILQKKYDMLLEKYNNEVL